MSIGTWVLWGFAVIGAIGVFGIVCSFFGEEEEEGDEWEESDPTPIDDSVKEILARAVAEERAKHPPTSDNSMMDIMMYDALYNHGKMFK